MVYLLKRGISLFSRYFLYDLYLMRFNFESNLVLAIFRNVKKLNLVGIVKKASIICVGSL